MGEIANDMINGFSCSNCGVYFEKEHSYPVLCDSCWEDEIRISKVKKGVRGIEITESGKQKHIYREL